MTTRAMPDWSQAPRGAWWPHYEPRSGLTGFGDRPVLHPAWREPDEDAMPSRTATQDPRVVPLPRFRAAA